MEVTHKVTFFALKATLFTRQVILSTKMGFSVDRRQFLGVLSTKMGFFVDRMTLPAGKQERAR